MFPIDGVVQGSLPELRERQPPHWVRRLAVTLFAKIRCFFFTILTRFRFREQHFYL
jgi:hypothetical protein